MKGTPFRVCLDVSPGVHGRAGIGRYALELAAALLTTGHGADYTLFYNRASEARVPPSLDRLPRLTTDLGDRPWRLRVLLAHLLGRPEDRHLGGIDLFHATDHLLPRLAEVRSVFSLHDLAFRLYPQTHTTLNRWYLCLMMPRFLRAADRVIAASESTRRDALRLYEVDEARVQVIPYGVDSRFRRTGQEAVAAVRRKYGLPERFILYVGTIEPRKNLGRLLEAYRILRDEGYEHALAIAGKIGWRSGAFRHRLRELGLEGQVILPGFVPDEDLPALYSAADLFAFPSLYEGFGLPILEAMACGTPVVCSGAASLPEVAGDAALLVPPADAGALATAMGRLLVDSTLREELRGRGHRRAQAFTWQKTAQETAAVYEELRREAGLHHCGRAQRG